MIRRNGENKMLHKDIIMTKDALDEIDALALFDAFPSVNDPRLKSLA